jgi:hypothetical protein
MHGRWQEDTTDFATDAEEEEPLDTGDEEEAEAIPRCAQRQSGGSG